MGNQESNNLHSLVAETAFVQVSESGLDVISAGTVALGVAIYWNNVRAVISTVLKHETHRVYVTLM
jgi:hypothetical protein